jgi:hypothetical protein
LHAWSEGDECARDIADRSRDITVVPTDRLQGLTGSFEGVQCECFEQALSGAESVEEGRPAHPCGIRDHGER